MNTGTLTIDLLGQQAVLLPQKALWVPEQKALVVADVHWGKAGHFRKAGMAIPARVNTNNADRLTALIRNTGAERVIFAGDLFHSRHNNEVAAFEHWQQQFPDVRFQLVIGNHDILPLSFYDACSLDVFPERLELNGLWIMHDQPEPTTGFVIHGHLHPGIRIAGKGRQQIAVPCFARSEHALILPAFGDFTGCHYLNAQTFRRLYAVTDTAVLQIK